jgi:hypothetical protein
MNKYMLLVASAMLAVGAVQAADNQPEATPQELAQAEQFVELTLGDLVTDALQQNNNQGPAELVILHPVNAPANNQNQLNNDDSSSDSDSEGAQHPPLQGCCELM